MFWFACQGSLHIPTMEVEEVMWKQVYTKLQAQKSQEYVRSDHEVRYASNDGIFANIKICRYRLTFPCANNYSYKV